MEISFSVEYVFFILAALILYLWNEHEHSKQISELKKKLIEDKNKIDNETKPSPSEPKVIIMQPTYLSQQTQKTIELPLPTSGTFIQVIFKKNGKKRYDYFLGDNYDIKVGDFVEVYVHDKWSGKNRLRIAKVMRISGRGEISDYANSTIIGKTNRPKWWK